MDIISIKIEYMTPKTPDYMYHAHLHKHIVAAFRGMYVVLRKIAMRDYQESVTTGQTHTQTDAGQSDPYVPLCFASNTKTTEYMTSFGGNFRI